MHGQVGIQGTQPVLERGQANPEGVKYRKLWKRPEYRQISPGEQGVPLMLEHMPLTAQSHLIDFGCGTGRAAQLIHRTVGCQVTMLDFVSHCLDEAVQTYMAQHPRTLTFRQVDLEQPIREAAAFGLCTDVMEHIPPDRVGIVLDNILRAANHVWFQISTEPDHLGALIGETLHLTVQPHDWWLEQFTKRECVIHYQLQQDGASIFYVSAWASSDDVMKSGRMNIEHTEKREHIAYNIAQGWQTIQPCDVQDDEVMIVGGGWSLTEQEETIRRLRERGVKLVTLNNAYNWCLERGLTPSATIVMDGREFNHRFVKPVVDTCKYLICSQVHPAVLEGLPHAQTYIWHDADIKTFDLLNAQYGEGNYYAIPGGSTSFLRSVPLLRMLGYTKFHVFGVDSCVAPDDHRHHAYAQPENDKKWILPVTLNNGRVFYCQPWMICQAQEFQHMITNLGELFELEVYGDGLLREILETAATAPLHLNKEG